MFGTRSVYAWLNNFESLCTQTEVVTPLLLLCDLHCTNDFILTSILLPIIGSYHAMQELLDRTESGGKMDTGTYAGLISEGGALLDALPLRIVFSIF